MKTSIPVVISPGMGETGLFYTETAYHLSRLGLGPFFVIDHRGNGFSQRFIDDLKVVHLDRFQSMVDDYTQFIQEIVIPYLNQKKIQAKPLSLSHSMGSAVNAIALEQEPWLQQFYRSAIFYSPMFKINFLFRLSIPWEGKRHSLLSLDLNLFDQKPLSWLISELKDWAPRANILGQGAVPVEFDPNNRVTSSEGHWLLRQRLENEFGEALVVEHVTNGWMGEAIQAAAQARDSGKSIRLPCLVIGAENDDLVLSSGLKEFVAHSPRAQLRMISHSKHAIHLENRPARRSLMRFIETMAHQEKHFSWAHINGDH